MAGDQATSHEALLSLLLTPGLGPTRVNRAIEAFGSAEAAVNASTQQWQSLSGIAAATARKIRDGIASVQQSGEPAAELQRAADAGVTLIARDAVDYPQLLRYIPDPPPMLWVRGSLDAQDALALGVVGARRCSHYGREQSERLAHQCGQAGLCIVSGGAYGIDAAAHRGALNAGARTIAVVGSGLANPYPQDHAALFDEIAARGALLSEFPMNTPPAAEHFPRRNRIISGMALGVLVIEAGRRSGALITARLCVEEHGRELMALPGRVDAKTSEGCHKIIREGWARLVSNAADVLDGLGEAGQSLKLGLSDNGQPDDPPPSLHEHNLSQTQQRLVELLAEPCTLDQVIARSGLPAAQVQSELTMLELRGTVRRNGGLFTRPKGST